MSQAGLQQVFLGIESASKASLARMKKGVRLDMQAAAVKMLQAHGVEINLGFIMFEPDTALEDVRANFDFLKANGFTGRAARTVNASITGKLHCRGLTFQTAAGRKPSAENRPPGV